MPVRVIVDPGAVHEHHLARVLADAREHRQAVGGRRPDQAGAPRRRHAHEDAGDVDVRDQRLVELRAELAARSRLLRVGADQAGDLPGDRGPRRRDVERHRRVRSAAADAAERGRSRRARRRAPAGVAATTSLVWNIAAWAVSYDVYLGTTQANMTLVGNVPAQMVGQPARRRTRGRRPRRCSRARRTSGRSCRAPTRRRSTRR